MRQDQAHGTAAEQLDLGGIFSPRERLAIRLGERDPAPAGQGKVRRWIARMTGRETPRPLADMRLEFIRNLVSSLIHANEAAATVEVEAAFGTGFPEREILALVAAYGPPNARRLATARAEAALAPPAEMAAKRPAPARAVPFTTEPTAG